ncbi:hypothetical protein [Phaeobacter gallaeciensis]|uniref:hypothetical protein n=1 Tax=Phaeobacter gallaeciensis TaxID=60890 RepID=UPI00237FC33E|nr:hypothetical protein [Phaeobacter gallaeciensis]MDE4063253.1 hypothetical protein [Phaeobacter gallaeciensis]MDE4126257.1 hypothetical protein [Phaeobacter gallaeciensis]
MDWPIGNINQKERPTVEITTKDNVIVARYLVKINALCEQLQEICKGGSKYLFSQNYQKADTAEILLYLIFETARDLRKTQKNLEILPAIPKIQGLMSQRAGMSNVKASVAMWDIVQFEIPKLMEYCESKGQSEIRASTAKLAKLAMSVTFTILTLSSPGAHAQASASTSGLAAQIQSLRTMMESFSDHASGRISELETAVGNHAERIEDLEALLELIAARPTGNTCTRPWYWDGNRCTFDDGHNW